MQSQARRPGRTTIAVSPRSDPLWRVMDLDRRTDHTAIEQVAAGGAIDREEMLIPAYC